MSSQSQMRRIVCALGTMLLFALLPTAASASSGDAHGQAVGDGSGVPTKDAFTGELTSGTGSLSGAHGNVEVDLAKTGANGSSENITLTFRGLGCGDTHGCVQPKGTLTGTMTAVPLHVPDTGTSFAVRAAGKLRPLGHVSANGTVHGTGFIASGYITMVLKLATKSGTVTVDAQAGPVNGFTSP